MNARKSIAIFIEFPRVFLILSELVEGVLVTKMLRHKWGEAILALLRCTKRGGWVVENGGTEHLVMFEWSLYTMGRIRKYKVVTNVEKSTTDQRKRDTGVKV